MFIVMDTNIFRQNFLLDSRKFEMLIDYIKKTNSVIILPDIIFQELRSIYKRELQKYSAKVHSLRGNLSNILVHSELPSFDVDADQKTDEYLQFILKKLSIGENQIIPYRNEYMPSLTCRAIGNIRPFTKEKGGFRDSIIWMNLLDIAHKSKEKAVTFISANIRNFADGERKLHPALKAEADQQKVEINYFCSLDDFIKAHAEPIEFINEQWILARIDLADLGNEVVQFAKSASERPLVDWIKQQDNTFQKLLKITTTRYSHLLHFYVYQMSSGAIWIDAKFEFELDIEYVSEEIDHDLYDYGVIDDIYEQLGTKYEYKHCHPIIVAEFNILVMDNEIDDYDLTDWTIS